MRQNQHKGKHLKRLQLMQLIADSSASFLEVLLTE